MSNADRIQPYARNPFYWQYKGAPVLLLGGSVEDNLFQIADIKDQLDLLDSLGGNYVRCTMSSRDEGDAWPFERAPDTGLYDLEQPGQDYWTRFERFLNLCAERDIILQIEVWDRFDFAREPWQDNPYNPKNNINYTVEESGLAESIDSHPGQKENAFFHTIPALENNALVLGYQQAQLVELLKRSRPYPNVLYCMDNETNESPEWGKFWSLQIKDQAGESIVQTTEMWDAWDLQSTQHRHTLDHPELYSFFDLSQNNHRHAEEHWQNPQLIRQYIIDSGHIRPMNSVKIYGPNTGPFGTHRDAQERLWRNIFGGLASSRFHRLVEGPGPHRDRASPYPLAARPHRPHRHFYMYSQQRPARRTQRQRALLHRQVRHRMRGLLSRWRHCGLGYRSGGGKYDRRAMARYSQECLVRRANGRSGQTAADGHAGRRRLLGRDSKGRGIIN